MRLRFQPEDVTSPAVTAEQRQMRAATPRYFPVAGVFAALVAAMALAFGLWALLTAGRVASFGMVATGAEVFHAPVLSVVEEVRVEPGDRVEADQVLYVLTSDSARSELDGVTESLAQERRVLEVALAQRETLFEDPVQELRDVTAARARLDELGLSVERARAAAEDAAARRAEELARAERHVELARVMASDRERRAAAAVKLAAQGAALADEVQRADEAAQRARLELADAIGERDRLAAEVPRGARVDAAEVAARDEARDLAERTLDQLEASYVEVKRLREMEKERGIENIRSRVAALETRGTHLRKLAGPTEIRALADGVVTEVLVSAGSTVPRDGVVMSVSGTGKVWINAFIPPERARDVKIGDEVAVYPTTGVAELTGKVTAGGGIQYRIPTALSDRISSPSAVYVRVDLDATQPDLIPGNVVKLVIR
ncbi:MAG TPA: HlyD family efflux transporter periplasmic adaptor subunit [Planctomycetota bacterium]|nr:HlyD family efflux transporter periplasmic adaptor subunit [Planctomycetota bacterium]